jgi:predicted restriction endonuclease
LSTTDQQYDEAVQKCRDLFLKKMHDYGCAWRILRVSSLTDQIFIKAQRIRTLQQKATQRVNEGQFSEFIGIMNYCVMALIQIDKGIADHPDLSEKKVLSLYNAQIATAKALMQNKNHDYGEAWRDMRVSSLTDLILQKLLRVKQIEDNNGETLVSEGLVGNYQDMINYAVFAIIHLEHS